MLASFISIFFTRSAKEEEYREGIGGVCAHVLHKLGLGFITTDDVQDVWTKVKL